MSLGLENAKRRISSVNNTKKITKAMELVATAKLKKWTNTMTKSNDYINQIIQLMQYVYAQCENLESEYLSTNSSGGTLYIVVTSSLGLCAGYNYNLYKFFDAKIKKEDTLLIIGTKGASHYRKWKNEKILDFVDLATTLDYAESLQLANFILSEFGKGTYQKISLVYTRYVNSMVFLPEILPLLPAQIEKKEEVMESKACILEPNPEEVLNQLVPFYVKSVLFGKLNESVVSEQASRRNAMKSATDNAEELIEKLNLEYNKARQAAITQEITEVVSGANAHE